MADPKEGFTSGIDRVVVGSIDSSGDFVTSETSTIGSGGVYQNVAEFITFLSTADAVTLETLTGGPYTVTINDGEDVVTLSADADLHNGASANNAIVKSGAWSPDGTQWYRILQVLDNDRFRLYVPYSGSNLSGSTLYIGAPIWRSVILNSGDYRDDDNFLFDFQSIDAAFLKIVGINGPQIGTQAGGTYPISPPLSGTMYVDFIDVSGTGYNIPFLGAQTCVAEAFLSRIVGDTYGVDFATGKCGSFRADACKFTSSNDGCDIQTLTDYADWYNCDLAVRAIPVDLVGSPFWFDVRLFFSSAVNNPKHRLYTCKLTADTSDGAPAPGKDAFIADSGHPLVLELNNCEIYISGYDGADVAVVGTYTTGTNMKANVKLMGCNINGDSDVNAPTIIEAQTWSGSTGGVEVYHCDLNGLSMGGGGDQTPSVAGGYNIA